MGFLVQGLLCAWIAQAPAQAAVRLQQRVSVRPHSTLNQQCGHWGGHKIFWLPPSFSPSHFPFHSLALSLSCSPCICNDSLASTPLAESGPPGPGISAAGICSYATLQLPGQGLAQLRIWGSVNFSGWVSWRVGGWVLVLSARVRVHVGVWRNHLQCGLGNHLEYSSYLHYYQWLRRFACVGVQASIVIGVLSFVGLIGGLLLLYGYRKSSKESIIKDSAEKKVDEIGNDISDAESDSSKGKCLMDILQVRIFFSYTMVFFLWSILSGSVQKDFFKTLTVRRGS